MRANITTHYTPLTHFGEKGIDVWLALEAFELVILKRYNVVALIAGDADYLNLHCGKQGPARITFLFPPLRYDSRVIAPSDADCTSAAQLTNMPLV